MALITGTAGPDTLIGTSGSDTITGLNGNDTLIGGAGIDLLIGGAGNDFYFIDITKEINKATADAGIDTVQSTVTYTLGDQQEHLTLLGNGAIGGTGNSLNNELTGNDGNNTLNGRGGNDTLNGGPGDDRLLGRGGDDVLIFSGADTRGVDGGDGTDTLRFTTMGKSLHLNGGDPDRFSNIEVIDLGNLSSTLKLKAENLRDFSTSTNTLRIDGGATDTMGLLFDVSSFFFEGLINDSGQTYARFVKGALVLEVDTDIDHNLRLVLSSPLNGENGFYALGSTFAGDVNGDGFADMLGGNSESDYDGVDGAGQAYVVFGGSSFASRLDYSVLDGTRGFQLEGIDFGDLSAYSVSSAGDVNGDGFGDLIVGAPGADPAGANGAGESYVVFGGSSFASGMELSALDGTNGFRLDGIDASDASGFSVSAAGDVNGDGFDDVIVGAGSADPNGELSAGESYVIFGQAGQFAPFLDLETLNGTNGFRLDGIDAGDASGISVSDAGDVNGDGFDDLIIGAPNAAPGAESYVVFGSAGFTSGMELTALNGTNGFRIDGGGFRLSSAGDVNGDGFSDVIVGDDSGSSYVVFGGAGFFSDVALSLLDGTNGFRLLDVGTNGDRYTRMSVTSAGDVNGDGFDDMIITGYSGGYLVFGRSHFSMELSALDGTNGFGLPFRSGSSVTSGDVNGDGFDDLFAGGAFVYGRDFRDEVDFCGGSGNDTFTGSTGRDLIVGGLGNDTLDGDGSHDALNGGAGDDVLFGAAGHDRLEGGSGNDFLDGGAGNDRLFGDDGADVLDGSQGNDTMTGGAGNDVFVFDNALGPPNIDTIMDFGGAGATELDMIRLDDAFFTALDAGSLAGAAFESGTDNVANAAATRIIYNTDTGALYYDADGSEGVSSSAQFAVLASDPDTLSVADFVVT